MIEKNKSRPSDRIVTWSMQEEPGSIQTKVPGGTKMWDQVPKRVEPNTLNTINWIFENTFHRSTATKNSRKVPSSTLQSL